MALIQVGIIAKRNPETGEFGKAMPLCKEIPDYTEEKAEEYQNNLFMWAFKKNIKTYIDGVAKNEKV